MSMIMVTDSDTIIKPANAAADDADAAAADDDDDDDADADADTYTGDDDSSIIIIIIIIINHYWNDPGQAFQTGNETAALQAQGAS